ncbi:MAG TPA: BON domain-containing protein [Burkholderiales bacterium]|nr:BON domain-containing protein [Burkholderiales bacterium]
MRRQLTNHAILAAALALAALPAAAAANGRAGDFAALDANHDGYLSKAETAKLEGFGKAFDEADANHDGKLDRDEFVKAGAIYDRIRLGKYVDDSVITAKVKAALVEHEQLKGFDISVQTDHGRVLLSGFVDNPTLRAQALKIASSVDGVRDVHDGIVVR